MSVHEFGEQLEKLDMSGFKEALRYVLTYDASDLEVEEALKRMHERLPGLSDALDAFPEAAEEMPGELFTSPEHLTATHAGAMLVFLAFSRMLSADELDGIPVLPIE